VSRAIRLEAAATEELAAAIAWYDEQRPGLGDALLAAVDEAIERLANEPDGGLRVPGLPEDSLVRKVFVKRFPYSLVYLPHEDGVAVIAVAHGSRRPGYWRRRMS
jgi:plasmid stabilization system protein ParE